MGVVVGLTEGRAKRVVILADGMTKDNHLEGRHMTEIGGEPLLPRTIRQFKEWATQVWVVCPRELGRQLDCFTLPAKDESDKFFGVDMIRKGLDHAVSPRTIIAFGDVWFTDEAHEVMAEGNGRSWAVYGRSHDPTGLGRWAEPFAIEVGKGMRLPMRNALEQVATYYMAGRWDRCTVWEWYYEMEGLHYWIEDPYNAHTGEHWVEINDETDDLDFQEDVERLRKVV